MTFHDKMPGANIVLVNAPVDSTIIGNTTRRESYGLTNMPPLGLLYLATVAKSNGYSAKIIDCAAIRHPSQDAPEILRMILDEDPVIVGISATTPQIRGGFKLAEIIRATMGNNVTIILGGAHVSADSAFQKDPAVFDVCVIGEGEITFQMIADRVMHGERVKGVYWGERPCDLDVIPFPARELVDDYGYFEDERRFANILTARGCPYNCIFCDVPIVEGQKLRFRSPKNVVDELEEIGNEYDWHFYFVDNLATVHRGHMVEISSEILRRGLDVTWACQTRVDLVDKSLLSLMYRAGCRFISFGVESGSSRVRKIINKNFSDEQILDAHRLCRQIGISTECSLMLGLPSETLEDLEMTIRLARLVPADVVNVQITELLPGTDLFDTAVSQGLVEPNVFEWVVCGKAKLPINYVPPGLSLEQLSEFRSSLVDSTNSARYKTSLL